MSTSLVTTPQGAIPALGIPDVQDYPRLVFTAPYFQTVPLAELIEPAVIEAVQSALPALVPQYVQDAANTAVAQTAVMLSGSTMSGPLFLSPVLPTQPSQAASMAYVDLLVASAGVPEVPAVPIGQTWARMSGQWVPVAESGAVFLPLGGGTMQGAINMSGNGITNLPAVPQLPNGAASAQWVLNQIAAQSLFQGTWTPDTNTPDLTQPGTHQNSFTWIATTDSISGIVVSQPIPGLQGLTIFNGDTIIFAALVGQFQAIHAGGLSLPEAQSLFLQLSGGQLSGPLLLNADPTSNMQAATRQWVLAQTSAAGLPEAPATGLLYGRNGTAQIWSPVLPLAGGILTGALTLAGNAVSQLSAVPLQQLTSSLAGYVPLTGNVTVTGSLSLGAGATLTLNTNAAQPLQAVPLQQLTAVMGAYLPLSGGTLTGSLNVSGAATINGNLGVGYTVPADAMAGLLFVQNQMVLPGGTTHLAWNAYMTAPLAWKTMAAGSSAAISLGASGLDFFVAPAVAAGAAPAWALGLTIDSTGNVTAGSNGLFGLNGVFATSDAQFGFTVSGVNRNFFFSATWYWSWNTSAGTLIWNTPGGALLNIRTAPDFLTWNAVGTMGGVGDFVILSDERGKEDVELARHGLDIIRQLQPVSFKRIPLAKRRDDALALPAPRVELGFIAQDVQAVLPEAVVEFGAELPDGSGTLDSAEPTLGLTNGTITAVLCNAVKELAVRLEALEHGGMRERR